MGTTSYYHQRRRTQFHFIFCYVIAGAFVLLTVLKGVALGAGLELYETGAPDLGTASAGRAAMAADASTAAANPAGLTLLDRSQLMVTTGALLPMMNFDVGSKTTTTGGGGGDAGVFFPIGGFFYARKLSDRIWLGMALYSDFGLSADFGHQWVGRYYVDREALTTFKAAPSIAYAVNKWLSVGVGGSFSVGRLTFKTEIDNLDPRIGDGNMSFESWDEAFGGNVGFLLRPIDKLRVGITYQSPVFFKFGFNPFLKNLGPGLSGISKRIGGSKVNISMEQPQQVMLSAVYRVLPNWSLMGNVDWQNWSAFGNMPVGISTAKQSSFQTANLHFSDTFQLAIGQQYRFDEKWLWSAGFAYDSSPVSEANRSVVLPVDRQLRYGTGLQYEVNRDVTVGVAWEFFDGGSAPLNNNRGPLAGTVQGHFSSNYINFVAFSLNWKF